MTIKDWAHLDIAGVMESHGEVPYLAKGMAGSLNLTKLSFQQNLSFHP